MSDAPPGDASTCFGAGRVQVCLAAVPTAERTFDADVQLDTDDADETCAATTSSAAGYCVIAATNIAVTAKLRATGKRPLVLVASHTITVTPSGIIDVGSHGGTAMQVGAGADPTAGCTAIGFPQQTGGGAGASFVGMGGPGGAGTNPGSVAGPVINPETVTQVRGGCQGGPGSANASGGHASGGHGGGAVYLIASDTIDVAGKVVASGQGGSGGLARTSTTTAGGGGAGGGAGGLIGLDAAKVAVEGLLLANGGGGGGGGDATAGNNGNDPNPSGTGSGIGGSGDTDSGTGYGGSGSSRSIASGNASTGGKSTPSGSNLPGAGGGGGGAGLILVPAATVASLKTMMNTSPPPTPL